MIRPKKAVSLFTHSTLGLFLLPVFIFLSSTTQTIAQTGTIPQKAEVAKKEDNSSAIPIDKKQAQDGKEPKRIIIKERKRTLLQSELTLIGSESIEPATNEKDGNATKAIEGKAIQKNERAGDIEKATLKTKGDDTSKEKTSGKEIVSELKGKEREKPKATVQAKTISIKKDEKNPTIIKTEQKRDIREESSVNDKKSTVKTKKESVKEFGSEKVSKIEQSLPAKTSHSIILNPGGEANDQFRKWSTLFKRLDIGNWAKRKGMLLIDDAGPVVDGMACFVSEFGSSVVVNGLKRDEHYTLWIDFVKFERYDKNKFPTQLKIYVGDGESNDNLLCSINYQSIADSKSLYQVQIPHKYSVKGSIELKFREFSPIKGFWGVWDMLFTDSDTLSGSMPDKGFGGNPGAVKGQKRDEKDYIIEIRK